MLIFINYTFNGESARICYDITGFSFSEAKVLIPEWLKKDNIRYDTYQIDEVLKSLLTNSNA
jgi:hypothetical protein